MGTHRAAKSLNAAIASTAAGAAAGSAADADARSVVLRDRLRAHWRDHVERVAPRDRERWLRTPEAIVLFGAKRCAALAREIATGRADARVSLASVPLIEAWDADPPGRVADAGKVDADAVDPGRRHAVRRVWSVAATRIGATGRQTQRLTPPQAVDVEDELDLMDPLAAAGHPHPASPSAVSIIRFRERNLGRDPNRW